MKRLKFYDVKSKKSFMSSKYKKKIKMVNGRKRYFAVTTSPGGTEIWRILSKADYMSK